MKTKVKAWAIVVLLLSGCSEVRTIGCNPAIDHDVMVAVWPFVSRYSSESDIAWTAKRVDGIETWKRSKLLDRCTSAAYDGWIWYHRRMIKEALEEKAKTREMEEWRKTHTIEKPN